MGEDAVELVEIALILHQSGARKIIEVLDLHIDHFLVHRLQQKEVFLQRDGDLGRTEFIEEVEEHGASRFSLGPTLARASPQSKG